VISSESTEASSPSPALNHFHHHLNSIQLQDPTLFVDGNFGTFIDKMLTLPPFQMKEFNRYTL